MHNALVTYFQGEQRSALAWGGAGLVALVIALAAWRSVVGYRAMAYPLVVVGAIQLALAGAMQFRTPGRVAALSVRFHQDPTGLVAAEHARMARVHTGFKVVEGVEVLVLIVGLALALRAGPRQAYFAVGLGLILAGAAMLVLDLAADRRADVYLAALRVGP